eukprot:1916755-Rhodomonas_salina.2
MPAACVCGNVWTSTDIPACMHGTGTRERAPPDGREPHGGGRRCAWRERAGGHRRVEALRQPQRLDAASAQGGLVGAREPEPALGHRHHRLPRAARLGLRRPSP